MASSGSPLQLESGILLDWRKEAELVISDVKDYVKEIGISQTLPSSKSRIYLNLRIFEGSCYTVELTAAGFSIVAPEYDTIVAQSEREGNDDEKTCVYETPFSLLDSISPAYLSLRGRVEFELKKIFPLQPAWETGKLRQGDILLKVSGIPVDTLTTNYNNGGSTTSVMRSYSFTPVNTSSIWEGNPLIIPSPTRCDRHFNNNDEDIHSNHWKPAISNGLLKPGDKLISANNVDCSKFSHSELVQFLRHCPERVVLKLYRDASRSQTPITSPDKPLFENNNILENPLKIHSKMLRYESDGNGQVTPSKSFILTGLKRPKPKYVTALLTPASSLPVIESPDTDSEIIDGNHSLPPMYIAQSMERLQIEEVANDIELSPCNSGSSLVRPDSLDLSRRRQKSYAFTP
ncbi:unnamed protein product [Lepeophtheirus salmonis]|uniref:(salmon louse) hypothetical protein n=1 Tax=Lepeophtheirus salmonis TaxID=72036 RepID=A0A7R8CMD7_LEPSM|nr:unnamed protein product [Lepeophtheirus salmonis]CAF2862716.1 unnamed protein product [Lepeophtheirus salmonis]